MYVRASPISTILLLSWMATSPSPSLAAPIKYCPGTEPCYTVCECPPGTSPCDQSNPPPCCLGSDPCPAVAAALTVSGPLASGPYVGDGAHDLKIQESLTIWGHPTPEGNVVVVEFFGEGVFLSSEKIDGTPIYPIKLTAPTYYAQIDLTSLAKDIEGEADSFRIHVDYPPDRKDARVRKHKPRPFHKYDRTDRRDTLPPVPPPTIFHLVESEESINSEEEMRIIKELGQLRSTRRMAPDSGDGAGMCGKYY